MRTTRWMLSFGLVAAAGFSSAAAATCSPGQVTVAGTMSPTPHLAARSGTDLAINAVFAVLPDGWAVSGRPDASGQVLVQWSKGRPWLGLLRTAARASDWCVLVDFAQRRVTIRSADVSHHSIASVAPRTPAPASLSVPEKTRHAPATTHSDVPHAPSSVPQRVAPPIPAATLSLEPASPQGMVPSGGRFFTSAGESVREVLSRWSQNAGYRVVWSVESDLPAVPVSMHFPAGTSYRDAVATLLRSYWLQGKRLSARVFAGHVVQFQGGA